MPERSRQHRQETHRLKPLPTCGEMLVSWKVSSSAFCEPLWFAAGACVRQAPHSCCGTCRIHGCITLTQLLCRSMLQDIGAVFKHSRSCSWSLEGLRNI